MKRILVVVCFFVLSLSAGDVSDFYHHFKHKHYKKACSAGRKVVFNNKADEKLTSLIAKSCLKADFIDTLGVMQSKLRKTPDARMNAVVLSSVLLQKRLIFQVMYDDVDISSFALPIIDHPISDTFVAFRDKSYKVISKKPKIIKFKHKNKDYRVYIDYENKGRIVIEVTDKNHKTTIHRYL